MFDQVKRLQLEEMRKVKSDIDNQIFEIKKEYLNTIEEKNKLERELATSSDGYLIKKDRFNIVEKFFTKRKEYNESKKIHKRIKELPKLIEKISKEVEVKKSKFEKDFSASNLDLKKSNIEGTIKALENTTNIKELGMNPIEAMQFLESHGIQPILNDSDKTIIENPRNYTSKSSFIGVHKTIYPPSADMIKTSKDSNAKIEQSVILNGEEYKYKIRSSRDTVHMAINDEVYPNDGGNWDHCTYSILMPLKDIPNNKIAAATPQDTFTNGSIELKEDSWIICPKNELKMVKEANPGVHVIGYEGETVKGYSKPLLTQLGYRGEKVWSNYWGDDESAKQFAEVMKKEGIKSHIHATSEEEQRDDRLFNMNKVVGIIKTIKENNLVKTKEDMKEILEQLDKQGQSFGKLLFESFKNVSIYDSKTILNQNNEFYFFANEMLKIGCNIDTSPMRAIINLSRKGINNINKNDISVLSPSVTNSDNENLTINKYQSNMLSLFKKEEIYRGDKDEDKEEIFKEFVSDTIGDIILDSKDKELFKTKETENKER